MIPHHDHQAYVGATDATELRRPGWAQSLAQGAVGLALLHIERARAGLGDWDTAHTWLSTATGENISAGANASLFYGAPAVAFAMDLASECTGRYQRALATLDASVAVLTRQRLAQAHARIDRSERPDLGEFDLVYGLTGLGAYHLRRDPRGDLTRDVLSYLVRLTEPLADDPDGLPGWWTDLDPSFGHSSEFDAGHGNLGMAHGITGPLALLALALRRGVVVPGLTEAIDRICRWLDTWRRDNDTGPWWPQWITRDDLLAGHPAQAQPGRPSWCYGTPGIARAQQLAGIATGDTTRQRAAEHALDACLADLNRLTGLTGQSLCHGVAGLYQTAWRAATDARANEIAVRLPHLLDRLLAGNPGTDVGLLEGGTGTLLALHTAHTETEPRWDTCLLIT